MPGPSPDPGLAGDWVVDIHRLFVSMKPQPRLQSTRQSSHARAKWVYTFFIPQVNSILRVRPGPPSVACHQQKEKTEKNVSVICGIDYCFYAY